MCDPITIAGIALTLGSTAANYVANQQVQAARDDALKAERIRQGMLDQEAAALNEVSRDRFNNFEGQQDQTSAQLGDYIASQTAQLPTAAAALPTSSSEIIVNDENAKRADARAFTDQSGAALGELRSFGDLLGGISLGQARDAGQIATIGGFKRGSSGVLPYELDEAGKSGNGMLLLADVLAGLGSVGTSAGLSGAKTPFGLFGNNSVSITKSPLATGGGVTGAGTPRVGGLFG